MSRKKKKTQQNQQTTRWKSHLFSISGRRGSKRISFAQILPRFPVPYKPAFQEKV